MPCTVKERTFLGPRPWKSSKLDIEIKADDHYFRHLWTALYISVLQHTDNVFQIKSCVPVLKKSVWCSLQEGFQMEVLT